MIWSVFSEVFPIDKTYNNEKNIIKFTHGNEVWDAYECNICDICSVYILTMVHDDVIKWKHFPRYWPLVRGIHRSPVNSPHKGHIFCKICARING